MYWDLLTLIQSNLECLYHSAYLGGVISKVRDLYGSAIGLGFSFVCNVGLWVWVWSRHGHGVQGILTM